MKRRKQGKQTKVQPWPAHLLLPDTIEEIERGRVDQPEPLDPSPEARKARLINIGGRLVAVRAARKPPTAQPALPDCAVPFPRPRPQAHARSAPGKRIWAPGGPQTADPRAEGGR